MSSFLDLVPLTPFGDGLQKILVEVGRCWLIGRAHDFAGNNNSAADSISA